MHAGELRAGRPEAAAVVWQWKADGAPATTEGSARTRVRGSLQAAVGIGIGLLVYGTLSTAMGSVILGLSGTVLLAAMLSPRLLYAGIERLFAATGRVLSAVVTAISMRGLFYGVFLPFGLLLRRRSRDRLKRFYEPERESYWSPVTPQRPDPEFYEKLY